MITTYLIMKIALQAVVQECNRLAAEMEKQEQADLIKSRIAKLEVEFASGEIDEKTYAERASEILSELTGPQPGPVNHEGGG